MSPRRLLRTAVVLASLLVLAPVSAVARVTVGIVSDGPTPVFSMLRELFTGEILALTEGEFEVNFPPEYTLQGDWTIAGIEQQINALQNDDRVDMVLTLGFVSSILAAKQPDPAKPIFSPLVIDANLTNLPRDGQSSGVPNINYLTEEVRFADDLTTFREIVGFKRLALLVDQTIFNLVPELASRGTSWAAELGIELRYVLNDGPDQDLVGAIPDDTDAVMVAALPRLDQEGRERLIRGLIERGLPSYSLIGTTPVERGMLAATAPDADWQRLARKTALNLQAVLLGQRAGDQEVAFRSKRRLTINMDTARALGISPRFDILSGATVLNEIPQYDDRSWSLSMVATEALRANLDLRASEQALQASDELEVQSRSLLRPQFNTSVNTTRLSDDNPGVVAGQAAERTSVAALNLDQIVYSEPALAAIKIRHFNQRARYADHRALELDIVESATVGFLSILKARTLVDIRRRGLELSRTNLDLARDRVRLGSTNASDEFRWRSEVATSRQELLAARAQLEQAMDSLNVLLDRPVNERFRTVPASLEDPSLLVSRQELLDIIDNQAAFNLMGSLFVEQGKQNAPELLSVEAAIAAAQRQRDSDRRSFWSPDVRLGGQVSRTIDESPALMASQEDENDWRFALTLTLPIYQGGQRASRVRQSGHTLEQLEFQRRSTAIRVEQRVRGSLHAVQSTFPSITLAAEAAEAARSNLDLVQDNYALGGISIIELLDARDAWLNADQRATDAVYDFLIDLMNLQRATAAFDFFLDDAAMDAAVDQIKQQIQPSD